MVGCKTPIPAVFKFGVDSVNPLKNSSKTPLSYRPSGTCGGPFIGSFHVFGGLMDAIGLLAELIPTGAALFEIQNRLLGRFLNILRMRGIRIGQGVGRNLVTAKKQFQFL